MPLYLYDHSGLSISTGEFSCPWDSGQIGWIYATKGSIAKMWGDTPPTSEVLREALESEVKAYDLFLRGGYVGYVIEDLDGETVDSCWGFDDKAYCLDEAKSAAKYVADKYALVQAAELASRATLAGPSPEVDTGEETMLDASIGLVRINAENRLYVLSEGNGYSCLGFEICAKRTRDYAATLDLPMSHVELGTVEAYRAYRAVSEALRVSGKKCLTQLTPQLVGLEGKRVEVVDKNGETRRFYVGKSTGWAPIHLEIKTQESHGGGFVTGAPFKSVRVIGER